MNHLKSITSSLIILTAALTGCGDDDASNGNTATSNTATSNTATSNTATSNTATSNTATSNTATSNTTDPLAECLAACGTLIASCDEEFSEACPVEAVLGNLQATCEAGCEDDDGRAQILAAAALPCGQVVPLAIQGFGLTEACEGEGDPCDGVSCADGEICVEGDCMEVMQECVDDTDDNNTAQSAATIELGRVDVQVERQVCADDVDWFSVTLRANQAALVDLTFSQTQGELTLTLNNGTGDAQIAPSAIRRGGAKVALPAREDSTTYTIKVEGADPTIENAYTLTFTVDPDQETPCNTQNDCLPEQECDAEERVCASECASANECGPGESCSNGNCILDACSSDPSEPNNGIDNAYLLSEGRFENLGICSTDGQDDDWFQIELIEASSLHIAVEFSSFQGDIDASLVAGSTLVQESTSPDDNEYISGEFLAGTYFLRVFSDIPLSEVAYTITVDINPEEPLCNDVGLVCSDDLVCLDNFRCYPEGSCLSDSDCAIDAPTCNLETNTCVACADDTFEPNDTLEDASVIDDNLTPEGTLNSCGSDDYFGFSVGTDSTITIDVTFMTRQGDLDIALFGPADSSDPVEWSDDIFDNERIVYNTGDQSGTYTLWIYTFEDISNTYELSIDIQ